MRSPNIIWAVCILAALSLGGCVVDATGTGAPDDEERVGVAVWDLTYDDTNPTDQGDDGTGDQGDEDTGDTDDGFYVGDQFDDDFRQRTDPHPDPWHPLYEEQAAGTGNHD